MFERFTHEARGAVVDAQRQARRLGHNYIGCEHLLLAAASADGTAGEVLRVLGVTPQAIEATTLRLVGAPAEPLDADALADIGIDLDRVRRKVEATFGADALVRRPHRRRWRRSCDPGSGAIPFTPRAKRCLQDALREAVALRHTHIGVEHIALALTAMTDGTVPGILRTIDVSAAQARVEILQRYRQAG